MTKIIFRMLVVLVILFLAAIQLISMTTGIDILKVYKRQILLGICLFCGLVMAMYIALAMLGIN